MELILASNSPRRRELMTLMGYSFSVEPSKCAEDIPLCAPGEYVSALAKLKAESVFAKHGNATVIGSDTIVYLNGEIIGKPRDDEDARRILSRLSGNTHSVYTGVAIMSSGRATVFYDEARVTFRKLSSIEIDAYIKTGEPRDKAGAYGIQGPASILVEKIDGNYFTVIGLPVPRVYEALREHGIYPVWM